MSADPDIGKEEGLETERQAAAMKDQLSKEVASWSKERRQQSSGTVIMPSPPVIQRRSSRSAGDVGKPSAPLHAGKPADARSKPFSMSYGGMTQAEYTQYRRDQGSR